MVFKVSKLKAYRAFDSRGNPTLTASISLDQGLGGEASVPSGASTGIFEALELRDGNLDYYMGRSVDQAIANVSGPIAEQVCNRGFDSQQEFDQALIDLDGSEKKSNLGANAILAASMAFARAASCQLDLPLYRFIQTQAKTQMSLPMPMLNIINGGAHANNGLDVQEFMVIPSGSTTFSEAMHCGFLIFHQLKSLLQSRGLSISVGDEGGFAPKIEGTTQALELLLDAIYKAGYEPGKHVLLALDVASSEFYDEQKKCYTIENQAMSSDDMIAMYRSWIGQYPIASIEDALAQTDDAGWSKLTCELGNKVQLVGDDLFTTNANSLAKGIQQSMANSILLKVNQVGSVTETLQAHSLAFDSHYTSVVSHRSGETADTFIADLAVGLATGQIKTGSFSRSDRIEKYNRLLRIEADAPELGFCCPDAPGFR